VTTFILGCHILFTVNILTEFKTIKMKQTYKILGMTCGGCKASVEKNLSDLEDVTNVVVHLEKEEVIVTMNNHIELETFQKSLPSKFTISVKEHKNVLSTAQNSNLDIEKEKSKFQQLKPLLLIIFYIAVASILLHYKNWSGSEFMLDFMGLFYIVFSFFKMLDLKGFPDSFRMYDPLAKRFPIYGWFYPFIETALGLMFLMRFEVNSALIITLIVLGITTIGVTKTLLDKKSIRCACLGTALKLPMTEATFIENAIMIVMAVLMLLNIF
jgi:cation transport ATPase